MWDICCSVEDYTTPNYMLGDGDQFHEVLCGKRMMSMKGCMIAGAVTSVVGLLTAIGAVYNPSAGWAERVVSFCTLAACTSWLRWTCEGEQPAANGSV